MPPGAGRAHATCRGYNRCRLGVRSSYAMLRASEQSRAWGQRGRLSTWPSTSSYLFCAQVHRDLKPANVMVNSKGQVTGPRMPQR
eukprot:scaffold29647_cov145-Isochrysis_galbana.AAC.9